MIISGSIDLFSVGYSVVEWTIRLAMLVFVPFRRSPDAARSWLLIVFFLPIPALILYLMIGRPTYPRWRRKRLALARQLLSNATDVIAHSQHCCRPILPAGFAPVAMLVENLGQFPTLGGNRIDLLSDYDVVIQRLIDDIDRAAHHIHILTYIFADDTVGARVIDALLKAAARGVNCRVLIDAIGSRRWAGRIRSRLRTGGVQIALALPVSYIRRRSARADLRNHRKIIVIDGETGYIGSQNIVDSEFSPGLVNRELVAHVTGPVVLEFQAVFIADWFLETGEALNDQELFPHHHAGSEIVAQLLPSGPDYPVAGAERLVVALIHGARSHIVITTPYFIPDVALTQALQTAVLRGVVVHLILSRATDNKLVRLAQRSYYDELLHAGVIIHLYRSGLLHAKHITIDENVSVIGSINIDVRSFQLNAEASLVIYDEGVTAKLKAEQDRNLANSHVLTLLERNKRSLPTKLVENIARLVSPLL